jgi:uncharacterized delta-60 repeat protein
MKIFTRQARSTVSTRRTTAKLRLELLEERQLLSGFGAADGASIVESWYSGPGGYQDVQIQPVDQKIVAAGSVSTTQGAAVARYDSVGNPDTSYGSNGLSTPPGGRPAWYAGLALQSDGKAVLSAVNTSGYFGAARFNTNGSLDTGFGTGGWSSVSVSPYGQYPYGVGLQSTGKVVVGGYTYTSGTLGKTGSAVLARFTSSGTIDSGKGGFGQVLSGNRATGYTMTAFGAQNAEFKDLAIQPDDKVVVVGDITPDQTFPASSDAQVIVARYTAAGILDTTFNGSGYSVLTLPGVQYTSWPFYPTAVALQGDGKIVVVSTAQDTNGHDMLVARFSASGTRDSSFGGGAGYVRLASIATGDDVVIQPGDQKIVVAGSQTGPGGNVVVARLNTDGTTDSTFGTGGYKIGAAPTGAGYYDFRASGMALQSNGNIIVAGSDYSGLPTVTINGIGSGATAKVGSDANGTITAITVTSGGVGYDASTTVTISGSSGSGATATATVSNGVVTGITVTNGGTGYDVHYPLLMRFFGSSTSTSSLSASASAAGSIDVTRVPGRLQNTVAFDTGGATATLSAEVPGVSTAFALKRGPKVVESAHALQAPGTAAAALLTTVPQALDPTFVPQSLDDQLFLDAFIAGKRRRSS